MSPLASIGCCCHFASRGRLRGVLATVQSGDREPHVRFDCREKGGGDAMLLPGLIELPSPRPTNLFAVSRSRS